MEKNNAEVHIFGLPLAVC